MPVFEVTFRLQVDDLIDKPMVQNWADKVMEKFREDETDSDNSKISLIFLDQKDKELYIDEDTLFRLDK